jgi:hypothetical protein
MLWMVDDVDHAGFPAPTIDALKMDTERFIVIFIGVDVMGYTPHTITLFEFLHSDKCDGRVRHHPPMNAISASVCDCR